MADWTITWTDLSGSVDGSAEGVVVTVVTGVATGGGGGGGAVDSVNGQTGTVVLTASSVGADASGAAATVQAASLQKSANLSDVASASTARTNLGLGTAATQAASAFDAAGAASTAQAASLQKSSNLSDLGNAGTARTNLGLGTSAAKDVPATGNASTSQVVYGTDTRLSDSRTPSAHASTHAAAGSDPVTISESQVTNLTTDLAAKVPTTRQVNGHALSADVTLSNTDVGAAATSHTHAESDITGLTTDLAAKAPLASPTFTGTPAAPTATAGTNTTQLATTAFVTTAVAGVSGGGMTDPTTTKGDLIVHGSSTTTRLGVGADNTVLTADSTQANGVKWAAAAGGSAWTQQVNNALTSATGFTTSGGTWSADASGYHQTATAAATRRAYWTTSVPLSVFAATCDIALNSGTGTAGLSFHVPNASTDGGMRIQFSGNGTNITALSTEVDNVTPGLSFTLGSSIAYNTFATLGIVASGLVFAVYVNGSHVTNLPLSTNISSLTSGPFMALANYTATATFKNLKVWSLTPPF